MKNIPQHIRSSGILAHITSLPSPYGIGDLGSGATDFLRFLADAKQSIWQILPLGPTHSAFSNSPYMTISAFAGNPLLISPDLLYKDGLLTPEEISGIPDFSSYIVDFTAVTTYKTELLISAFHRFRRAEHPSFTTFTKETPWLSDYCLFMALKSGYPDKGWFDWPTDIRNRDREALVRAEEQLQEKIHYFQFEQFIFFRQWQQLRKRAAAMNIELFGDIPIYVSLDSADVWANQEIFQLDRQSGRPTHVAGVPPDYFSDTGQKWGNPLYRWNTDSDDVKAKLNSWWEERFTAVFSLVDIARIDHFRGFQAYWAVPADHKTAMDGEWSPGPGTQFFNTIYKNLGPLKIVAEDLGDITEDVIELRNKLNFPGMKVLQFAFDGNRDNSFLPFNFESSDYYVYTGTHDNNTSIGWYLSDRIDDKIRKRVKLCANRELSDGHSIHRDLIYLAMSSTAVVSIYPLQDVLGFGEDCRMNIPGTDQGNWIWRCSSEFLSADTSSWLGELTSAFNRARLQETDDGGSVQEQSQSLSDTKETKS